MSKRDWQQDRLIWESKEHTASISVVCSSDGSRIATAGYDGDGIIRVWDVKTGNQLLDFQASGWISDLLFSPDGRRLFSAGWDTSIRVWGIDSGGELLVLAEHQNPVLSIAITQDGRRLLSGDADGRLFEWEAASESQVEQWLSDQSHDIEMRAKQKQYRARRQLAQQKSLSRADGVIDHWLVMAPLPYETGTDVTVAIEQEQIENESQLMPMAGERDEAKGKVWRRVQTQNHVLDFNEVIGSTASHSVGYAVSYLHCESAHADLVIKFGCEVMAKVYLNGTQLSMGRVAGAGGLTADAHIIEGVNLEKGVNTLVFKVVNQTGDWRACMRITDRDGSPVEGLSARVDRNEGGSASASSQAR